MKKQYLKHYDTTVEDVFSYYYERTYDRGKSLELVREHFIKGWDTLSEDKFLNREAVDGNPKSTTPHSEAGRPINQFGY